MDRLETIKKTLANKRELIRLKKGTVKLSDGVESFSGGNGPNVTKGAEKAVESDTVKAIANTYLWMDSHKDVHALGCFKKSIKENQTKIFHLHDHEYKLTAKVGSPESIYETKMPWRELGIDKDGETESLVMVSKVSKELNSKIYKMYMDGEINQHSVGMQYVKVALAADDEDDVEAKELYDEYIKKIGNPEEAEKNGWFWVVYEAKVSEVSCVLKGSNILTQVIEETKEETKVTEIEPSNDTREEPRKSTLEELMNNYK